jgi:hypothetical protein
MVESFIDLEHINSDLIFIKPVDSSNQPHFEGTGRTVVYHPSVEQQTDFGMYFPISNIDIQSLIIQLSKELKMLSDEVKTLRDELNNRPIVSSIQINTINSTLQLTKPIFIVLEESNEESLARWPEVNAYGLGQTATEAIDDLKQNISDLYADLTSREAPTLGEIALSTLNVLNTYVSKIL